MSIARHPVRSTVGALVLVAACAGSKTEPRLRAPAAPSAPAVTGTVGHELMVAERRCQSLARRVWSTADAAHDERARLMGPSTVADVLARVDTVSQEDPVDGPRREDLVKVTRATADAFNETAAAVHAAERLRRSVEQEPQGPDAVDADSLASLRAHAKLDALLKVEAGDLSKEARGLALLCAMVRIDLAHTLPPRLKLYATADTFALLFGVAIPDLPRDATGELARDTWQKLLSVTDERTGCRPRDPALRALGKTPDEKDTLAWADVVCGLWQTFHADYSGVSKENELVEVIGVQMYHLQSEWRGVRDGVMPRAREP